MNKIIKLLQHDARMTISDLSSATGLTDKEVRAEIAKLEKDGLILGYAPVINWQKIDETHVQALVEVRFSLNYKMSFEELSTQIANMNEVDSVSLMSGGYDLLVGISGKSIQEIAFFVNERLSAMEHVLSTTTHFVLKPYKEHGFLINNEKEDKREAWL